MFVEEKIEQEWYEMCRQEMWRWCYGRWALGLLVNNELLQHGADDVYNLEPINNQELVIIEDT